MEDIKEVITPISKEIIIITTTTDSKIKMIMMEITEIITTITETIMLTETILSVITTKIITTITKTLITMVGGIKSSDSKIPKKTTLITKIDYFC